MITVSADIIILGLISGFILYKLFKILGQRDDDNISTAQNINNHNIIDISQFVKPVKEEPVVISETELKLTENFKDIVATIKNIDPKFSLEKFLNGAKNAFEMILTAFAENDRETLKNLLDNTTYQQFASEIDARIKNDVTLNLTLVSLPIVDIKDIQLKNTKVFIDVFFQSQQITILKNNKGEIIEGDVSQVDSVNDTWTFGKELNSKDTWHLVKVSSS